MSDQNIQYHRLREYIASQRVCGRLDEITFPGANRFYTFLFCAMREADTHNTHLLQSVFPDIYEELRLRYNAGGGALNDVEMEFVRSLYAEPEEIVEQLDYDVSG